mgnify:CR=1 FL=1
MIQENIQSIIRQRQPLALRVMKARESLSAALEGFERFNFLCRETFQDKDLAKEFNGVVSILEEADKIAGDATKRLEELKHIQKRLTRNTLNIAVIGRARQGKSRLLQTITGLTADEIPDSNGGFCTGVRSDIINEDTEMTYAIVNFLTEAKFISENVTPYFAELKNFFSIVPTSLSEFKSLSIPMPEDSLDTSINQHLKHLADLQRNIPQYEHLLDQRPRRIKKEEIRLYVAQDDKEGNRGYYNYLAVESVEIFCRFPNSEVGALRLIDLPGLGDTKLGDVGRVVNALKDQVDLVLFLTKPSNAGAGWQDIDTDLYSQARSALGEKLPIERWAFWVFNHDSRAGADNEIQCKLLRDSISDAQIKVAQTIVVDCTHSHDVSKNLIDVALAHLSRNIERNDREYAENIQSMVNSTVQNMRAFVENVRALLKDDDDFDKDSDTFDVLFEDLWDALRGEMQACVGEDSRLRANRKEPYMELMKEIEQVLEEERTNEFPLTEEEIKRASRGEGGVLTAYQNALHYLRTRLSGKLQISLDRILDDLLKKMKSEFTEIFATTGKLNIKRFDNVSNHELLGKMIDYIQASGNSETMPTILKGLKFLDEWTMSYRSFIQHRLRGALNVLDYDEKECQDKGTPRNASQAVEILRGEYEETIYKVKQALDGIYTEPNEAAFAVAEEFKDIMIRSNEIRTHSDENEKPHQKFKNDLKIQWRRFYRPIRGDVWPDEYGHSQRRRDINTKLRAPLDSLLSMFTNSSFDFLR